MRAFQFVSFLIFCATAVAGDSPVAAREPVPFRVRMEIAPNGFEAVRFDPKTNNFSRVELAPDPLAPHAELVEQALARVPSWLRDDVHAQLRALLMSPIRVQGIRSMAFEDVNRDGRPDLVVVEEKKKLRVFIAPLWIESNTVPKLRMDADGKILGRRLDKDSQKTIETYMANVGAGSVCALGDVTGDGRPDLVVVDTSGIVAFCRNRSLSNKAEFQIFSNQFRHYFSRADVGLALRPAALPCEDKNSRAFLVGNKDGGLFMFMEPAPLDFSERRGHFNITQFPSPRIKAEAITPTVFVARNKQGGGVVVGCADGSLKIFTGKEWDEKYAGFDKINVGDFAAPAFGDLDGDGDWDLVVGNGAGELKVFKNLEMEKGKIEFEEITDKSQLGKIKVNHSASPALGDVNGDGKADLLLGAQDGTLRLFLSPDFVEDKETFAGVRVGELSAPAFIDVNGDGKLDVVAGNARGQLLYYENVSGKERLAWVEKYSKDMSEKNEDGSVKRQIKYAGNYYRDREILFGANDAAALEDYARLLRDCPKEFVDEIAFVIANTSAEVLRTMSRTKQADILLENAKAIYEMAGQLKYVSLKEYGDYTTLEVSLDKKTKQELPRDIYYWWVVHPRIYHEIPWRVNASWWDVKPDQRGMSRDDWLRHKPEPDPLALSEKSSFWRSSLPHDKTHGKSLLEVVKAATTVREAVERMHLWISNDSPEGFMRFGYITNDAQPNIVFKKAYGSCGELSILSTALARAALVPTAMISKFGEDHQWMEFYDGNKWVHWDAAHLLGVDAPWVSNEGRRHANHLSAVVRTWGNDYSDCTTATASNSVVDFTSAGTGYTDTGSVTVTVRDAKGRAVDGALVVVHNRDGGNQNLVTWGYTDAKGECLVRLGGKPNGGYSFEVVSPYGQAGTEFFHVAEGKAYSMDYQLTGEIVNPRQAVIAASVGQRGTLLWGEVIEMAQTRPGSIPVDVKINAFAGLLRPPSFFTSHAHRVGGVDCYGVHQFPHPILNAGGVKLLVLDRENFEKFKQGTPFKCVAALDITASGNTRLEIPAKEIFFVFVHAETQRVHHKLDLTFSVSVPGQPPSITTRGGGRQVINVGESVTITGTASDNGGIAKLLVRANGLGEWQDITHRLDTATGKWSYVVGERSPLFVGLHTFEFKAVDFAGNETVANSPVPVEVRPAREFKGVKIFQDDPDDHLKRTGWILGPFRITSKERFIEIVTDSPTKGFDLDVYLYADKNRNGKIDGASELVGKSTTPHAKERIFLNLPEDTTYWLYCNGHRVPNPPAVMNLKLSFDTAPRFILDYAPVGFVKTPGSFSAKFQTPFGVNTDSVKVFLNGAEITERCKVEADSVLYQPFHDSPFEDGKKYEVRVEATDNGGNKDAAVWEFTPDDSAPHLELAVSPPNKEVAEKFELEIKAADNVGVNSITYQLDTLPPVAIANDKTAATVVSVLSLDDGEHKLTVKAADMAGNQTVREIAFTVKNPPIAVASVSPADGAKISDDRPAIRVNLWSRAEIDPKSVKLVFDGADVTEKAHYVSKNKQLLFIPPLLKRGKHTLSVSFADASGNKVENRQTTFEVE